MTEAAIAETALAERIAAVRRFNRFYTRRIGVLTRYLNQSRFSLSEARVLYELNNREAPTASDLARDLGLDAGYLSRILSRFEREGFVRRTRSAADSRQSHLHVTAMGRATFAPLNEQSRREVGALLAPLDEHRQREVVQAMERIERLLAAPAEAEKPLTIRTHRPGDLGWVVSAHGRLYAEEFGWDQSFEGLVAEIVAKFQANLDPARERCWIAELGADRVGSVFLVRQTDEVAKLRLLIVEPAGRGRGVGRRLVAECLAFARACGYRRVVLWTNSVLLAARKIYIDEGFVLTASEPHRSFGQDLIGETWELAL
ncbi:MAG TPA: MarR family winged helix-turn-helix transcriptional regulator [Kiloniellales bacterium]|nr:MarR family winged helix-turn-helix transcriptional regulator [Kiloniellales bacterium]